MEVLVQVRKEITQSDIDKAKKRMDWLFGFMVVRYTFIYQVLGMMTKKCEPYSPYRTMAVCVLGGGRLELRYDPEYINSHKDEELTYVIYHEILHVALHHCTSRQFDDHMRGNIAHDLAVNELIKEEPGVCIPPADGGTFVADFKKMPMYKDIKDKETAEWYYDFLNSKEKKKENQEGKGQGRGQPNPQQGGGGKGTQPGQTPDKKKGFDDHGGWKQDEIADEIVRDKINEIAKNNLWGDMSGVDQEVIKAAQVRRINWRSLLRRFYGNFVSRDRESTRKRPNRRTGIIHPGTRRILVDRHLVGIDTSGSISSDLLAQFLSVINRMTEYVPIDIVQFDASITDPPKPFDRKKNEFKFTGRGGTCFQPLMDLVEKQHYKSVVILTDGEGRLKWEPDGGKREHRSSPKEERH